MEEKKLQKSSNSFRSFFGFGDLPNSSFWSKPNPSSAQFTTKGFTLIELIVVVAIAALLLAVFLLSGNPRLQINKANDVKRKHDLQQIKNALDMYYDDHKCYPQALPTNGTWEDNNQVYIKQVPTDPETGAYIYQTDTTNPCPQWNVLYAKYAARKFTSDDCLLSSMSACGYAGVRACVTSGSVDCSYISTHAAFAYDEPTPTLRPSPTVPLSPTPTPYCTNPGYIKDTNNNCNVAPAGNGVYCDNQCKHLP